MNASVMARIPQSVIGLARARRTNPRPRSEAWRKGARLIGAQGVIFTGAPRLVVDEKFEDAWLRGFSHGEAPFVIGDTSHAHALVPAETLALAAEEEGVAVADIHFGRDRNLGRL